MSPTVPNQRALILSRPVIIAALAAGFGLIFSTALLVAFSINGLSATDHRSARTQHALGALAAFTVALTEATQSVVGFDSDGAAAASLDVNRYAARRAQARAELATAAAHLPARPEVQELLADVQRRTEAHFTRLNQQAAPQTSAAAPGEAEPDNVAIATSVSEIHELVATLQRNAFAELAEDSAGDADKIESIQWFTLALLFAAGTLAIAMSLWLLRRVRDLEGLITVCAWTRRVQWQGRWVSFEEYLSKRFNLYVTHGICEEAAEKMRAEAANTPIPADFLQ